MSENVAAAKSPEFDSVLETVTREVAFKGQPLKVAPLQIGQVPAFSRAIRPMFSALTVAFSSTPSVDGEGGGGGLQVEAEELLNLAADHGDQMIDAVAVAVRKDRADIAASDPVEFMDLLVAVIEVNSDFFARAVAKAAKGSHRRASGTGQMRSNS